MSANTNTQGKSPIQVINPRMGDWEAAGIAADVARLLGSHGHTDWARHAALEARAAADRVKADVEPRVARYIKLPEMAAVVESELKKLGEAERWAQEAWEAAEIAEFEDPAR